MAKIIKTNNSKCHRGSRGNKWKYHTLLTGMKNGTTTLENDLAVSYAVKHTPSNPEIPLLGIYLRRIKIYTHSKTCTQVFIATLFLIAKNGVLISFFNYFQ